MDGIYETTEYPEIFLRNLLLNENHPFHNRTMHVSGTFKDGSKPEGRAAKADIDAEKADIQTAKPDIDTGKPDFRSGTGI